MVNALPLAIRLKLERTLALWRHWRPGRPLPGPPQVVEVLPPGLSNYSIRVSAEDDYVVRIDGVDPRRLGLNRAAEWRALQLASEQQLAPSARYFNPELGCLVCDYLPPTDSEPGALPAAGSPAAGPPAAGSPAAGSPAAGSPAAGPPAAIEPAAEPLAAVAGLLRGIHRLPAIHHRLDLPARLQRYERHWPQPEGTAQTAVLACRRQVLKLLQDIGSRPQARVLCHNDLLRANRLRSAGRLWAIDWEYCAMGNPWFDLAVVAAGDQLDGAQRTALLKAYLQREPTSEDFMSLHQHSCIYRYLELLWHGAVQRPGADEEGRDQRLKRLQASLCCGPQD